MTACLLYAKIHKNKAENLLHLMLYFSAAVSCKNAGVLFRTVMLYYNVFDYPAGETGIQIGTGKAEKGSSYYGTE